MRRRLPALAGLVLGVALGFVLLLVVLRLPLAVCAVLAVLVLAGAVGLPALLRRAPVED